MEERIIELREILFKIENLNKEISDLSILLDEYEEKIDKIDDKINSSLFNIRERIDYLINERTKTINIIDRLEVNKKKLRTKIIMTIVSIICFGISLTIDNFNVVSVISFVTSIKCISITILNIISNKKKKKELEKYSLEEIDNSIKLESDNLNNKYSKLNKLVQRKENLKEEKIILNGQRLAKRKMVVNLEREKNKKYGEFISLIFLIILQIIIM